MEWICVYVSCYFLLFLLLLFRYSFYYKHCRVCDGHNKKKTSKTTIPRMHVFSNIFFVGPFTCSVQRLLIHEFHFTYIYFWSLFPSSHSVFFLNFFIFIYPYSTWIHSVVSSCCCFTGSVYVCCTYVFERRCKKQLHNRIFVDDVILVESDSIGNNFIGLNILLWMCY